jgi:hypothetical protein
MYYFVGKNKKVRRYFFFFLENILHTRQTPDKCFPEYFFDVPLESVDGSQDEQQSRRPARGKYGDRRGTGLGPA